MILPLIWLKDYVNIKKSPADVAVDFTSLGLMLDKPIEKDVLDLEHRMDRSDWLSIVGCARDLAAMEGIELKLPEGEAPESAGDGGVKIEIEAPDLVRRFNTRVFRGVKIGPSPKWISERLEAYGMPSINNIVDITNFVMVEIGQPMHAQDISKFAGEKPQIIFRRAKDGEEVATLLGEKIQTDSETLLMTDGEKITAIGGVVGTPATAVDESTTDIILDAGNYNQANIRKTSRRLGIRNETVARTEKFLHPHLTQIAIERATKLILELAGGQYFENEDYYPNKVPLTKMELRFSRVEKIGGIEVSKEKIRDILTALEYNIRNVSGESISVEVPYFRTDVVVEDDIVSDILRINGYDEIPLELMNTAPPAEVTPEIYELEEKCRDILVGLGMHEHITTPLVQYDSDNKDMVKLENSLNSEQSALRTSIYSTLAPVIKNYHKHRISNVKVFEIGKVYKKDLSEIRVLEGVIEGGRELMEILSAFFLNLGISGISYKGEKTRSGIYQGSLEIGEARPDSFTIYTEKLLKAKTGILRTRDKIFHRSTEDVTVELGSEKPLGETVEKIKSSSDKIVSVQLIDRFKKGRNVAYTFRAVFESPQEISEKELSKIRNLF